MKVIYLIRHGQTLFNRLVRMQGISDTPLTAEGEARAAQLGDSFLRQGLTFGAAYSSDLGRARQTAHLILDHSAQSALQLQELPELREVSFGFFEGADGIKTWQTIAEATGDSELTHDSSDNRRIQKLSTLKRLDETGWAEDFQDVRARAGRALHILMQSDAECIMAVSHGMFINCLLYSLLGDHVILGALPNTSVTKLVCEHEAIHVDYIGREKDF
ncbi:MAG: histidine phosphatase family protein [Sporolactobacillus sp.]